MGKIAVLPKKHHCRAHYLEEKKLPATYMEDFTLMGFLVEEFDKAVSLLKQAGYYVEYKKCGSEILIHNSKNISDIGAIFSENNIKYSWSDVADTIYQA